MKFAVRRERDLAPKERNVVEVAINSTVAYTGICGQGGEGG